MKIGIDLGGSHIAIGVVDSNGEIIEKTERRILDKEKRNITEFIESYISQTVNDYITKYKITSVGIAIPGTLDKTSIIKSVNLGVENYEIVDRLKKKIDFTEITNKEKGIVDVEKNIVITNEHNEANNIIEKENSKVKKLPIRIKNDAKCAALAENSFGSLKNYSRSLFLTLGTGIGGAVIINNELLDTGDLPGMEVGHMVIEKGGLLCNCGNRGCFEKYASMKAFKNNLRNALGLDETTRGEELLNIMRSFVGNSRDIIENVINEFIQNLSIGIANLVNLFEPEAIVIGGSFAYFEDVLLDKLKDCLKNEPFLFNRRDELIIKPAVLGNDAGIIGASLL